LDIFAGTNASGTDNAFTRVVGEIGVRRVFLFLGVGGNCLIPYFTKTHLSCNVLEFTIPIGGTSEAIQRMIRYVQFHDPSPQLSEVLGLGPYHQTLANGLGARGHRIFSTVHFYQAHSARSECF
jgi:hypothetical protein